MPNDYTIVVCEFIEYHLCKMRFEEDIAFFNWCASESNSEAIKRFTPLPDDFHLWEYNSQMEVLSPLQEAIDEELL